MNDIPPWVIKKGIKIIGKKVGGQIDKGDDTYGTDTNAPGIGTVNGTGGGEVITDQYSQICRQAGWDGFDYQAFNSAVEKRVRDGADPNQAGAEVFGELVRNNPQLGAKIDQGTSQDRASPKARDAALPVAADVIKGLDVKADGPMARQVEADIARYIDAGMPPEAAATMARQNAERDMATEKQNTPPSPPDPQGTQPEDQTPQQPFFPPREGKADTEPPGPAQQQAQAEPSEGKDQASKPDEKDGEGKAADPRVTAMTEMTSTPVTNPGQSALLKPVEKLTEPEMQDMIASAQGDYRGWRSGDPMKTHTYEKVQDWHVNIYGDQPQANDGGKPVDPRPIRPIPTQVSPHATPDGQDLWQATGKLGQQVADAAATDGYENAVTGLQRGLNILNRANPLPTRSPAYGPYTPLGPVDEDGAYGPQTDFALKQATARLGSNKVAEGFALGRFNTFARNAQRNGNADGLEAATHDAFGPLFRSPADTTKPKVEAGVLQETLNDIGVRTHDDWEPLKVDDWIGPKTTAAFGKVLKNEDADSVTTAFGRGLGFL